MTSAWSDEVIAFDRNGARLWGILSRPAPDAAARPVAVLVIVGGPQYRVGSHRQFVSLARALARAGYPTLRFDYSGMGDSDGARRNFDAAGPDVAAALDTLVRACPGHRIVVWGLCDAASAALMFASGDPRVAGIVAANPWVRSDASYAATQVKHYYAARLLQRDFWRKALRGGLQWGASLRSFTGALLTARTQGGAAGGTFQDAMARGVSRLRGRLLLILSGNDLTAKEFVTFTRTADAWKGLLDDPKVSRVDLVEADHTFSRRAWLDAVEAETITWLNRLGAPDAAAAATTTS
jgi:exosortase A-associated hydrolase 1